MVPNRATHHILQLNIVEFEYLARNSLDIAYNLNLTREYCFLLNVNKGEIQNGSKMWKQIKTKELFSLFPETRAKC